MKPVIDGQIAIAQREPGLKPRELIARSTALRPMLREQDDCPNGGTYSAELHEAFTKAGFYRILQPKRLGGYEFDYLTYFKAMVEISKGHPSIGWHLTQVSCHTPVIAAHWCEQAQIELFGKTGHFAAPHSVVPAGTCERVGNGYIVSGTWRRCEGIGHCTHAILATFITGKGGRRLQVNFVVPAGQCDSRCERDGDATFGAQNAPSTTISLDQVFVPDHMFSPSIDTLVLQDPTNGTIGTRRHGNPMYLGLTPSVYQAALVAPTLGAAFAALDEYGDLRKSIRALDTATSNIPESSEAPQLLGIAEALVDSAEGVLHKGIEKHMEICARWDETRWALSVEELKRSRAMLQQSGKLACEAIELLFRASGKAALRRGARMMRYFDDAQRYRSRASEPSNSAWSSTVPKPGDA